ncbi:MAG: hypothetical protein U0234_00395 [Sandaracinus sp.]
MVWLAILALGAGAAAAQGTGDSSDGTEDATTGVTRRADLTPEEQLAEAERVQTHANELSQRVMGMLDEARRDGDVTRVTCLDDKLTQINAHARTLSERVASLQEATTTADTDRRNHEFTVITVLSQNVSQLEADANECIGQSLFETGSTRVVTEIAPETPTGDVTLLPEIPPDNIPYVPTPISPTI